MERSRHGARVTGAYVLAGFAVLLAVGGTSYAAGELTGADIKNGSLTGKDVKDGSLRQGDFKVGDLPGGAPGPTGATGVAGPSGPAGPGAHGFDVTVANGAEQQIPIGAHTLKVTCFGTPDVRKVVVQASGPNGGAQLSMLSSRDDLSTSAQQSGALLGPSLSTLVSAGWGDFSFDDTGGHFFRKGGTMVLHGSTTTTVVFDLFLDDRADLGTCSLRGTATPST